MSTQEAVQPFQKLAYYDRQTIAAADSVTLIPGVDLDGLTFATSAGCSLRIWGTNVVTRYMHFEGGEAFEFPDLDIDSLRVKAETNATTVRVWGWRR